jgi:hypothetical protein
MRKFLNKFFHTSFMLKKLLKIIGIIFASIIGFIVGLFLLWCAWSLFLWLISSNDFIGSYFCLGGAGPVNGYRNTETGQCASISGCDVNRPPKNIVWDEVCWHQYKTFGSRDEVKDFCNSACNRNNGTRYLYGKLPCNSSQAYYIWVNKSVEGFPNTTIASQEISYVYCQEFKTQ